MTPPSDPDSIAAELAELRHDITARAIARWEQAKAEADEAGRLVQTAFELNGGDRGLDSWTDLLTRRKNDAERDLIGCILAWGPDYSRYPIRSTRPHVFRWPARGVRSRGMLYLAVHDPDHTGDDEDQGYDLTHVIVCPESSIVDLEDIPNHSVAQPPGPEAGESPPTTSPLPFRATIEAPLAEFREAARLRAEACDSEDFHQLEVDKAAAIQLAEDKRAQAALLDVIRGVIRACPRDLPGEAEWYDSAAPLWSTRSGGRLFLLSRTIGINPPATPEEAAQRVVLTIIDDPGPA